MVMHLVTFPHSAAVFERLANSKHPPPTIFSRSHATQHICFLWTEDSAQKSPFCVNRRNSRMQWEVSVIPKEDSRGVYSSGRTTAASVYVQTGSTWRM